MTNNPKGSFPRGQFPGYIVRGIIFEVTVREQKSGGNHPLGNYPGGNYLWGNCPGGNFPWGQLSGDNHPGGNCAGGGAIIRGGGAIFLRGNCPDAELL